MACEINKVILKAKNLRVVGETSISIDKLTNILIQKVQKTKKMMKVVKYKEQKIKKQTNQKTIIQQKFKIKLK